MTEEQIKSELTDRKRQLRVREGKSGFKANVEALKARIAELEAML